MKEDARVQLLADIADRGEDGGFYDVVVCGAGVSGCAAAVAAARTGARTLLTERNAYLGGIATSSMISNIYNHFVTLDGRLVMRGIPKEVADRLVSSQAGIKDWAAPDGRLVHDPEYLKVVLAEMLLEAKVDVMYHALAAGPIMEGDTVGGVILETKQGRLRVGARVVIDTTGECDVAYQAGAPLRWASGLCTLTFKMGNVDLEGLYRHFKHHPDTFPVGVDAMKGFEEFERNWLERGFLYFPHSGGEFWNLVQDAIARGDFQKERGRLFGLDSTCIIGMRGRDTAVINSQFWRVTSLDASVVTAAEMDGVEACFYVADFFKKAIPGFANAHVTQLSEELAIRASRAIVGEKTFTKDELTVREIIENTDPTANGTDVEYVILKNAQVGAQYSKSKAGTEEDIYMDDVIAVRPAQTNFKTSREFVSRFTADIPYSVLVPRKVENLLVASGKSVSAVPQTMLRYQSAGMAIGQAAGVSAALCVRNHVTPRAIDIRELQLELLRQGVYLGSAQRLDRLGLTRSPRRR
jgi:hypothetical protein